MTPEARLYTICRYDDSQTFEVHWFSYVHYFVYPTTSVSSVVSKRYQLHGILVRIYLGLSIGRRWALRGSIYLEWR